MVEVGIHGSGKMDMTPIVLVPGLLCSAEVFTSQSAALWSCGSVTVASTLGEETMEGIASSILRDARRALRWPAFRWADMSAWKSCARRRKG